MIDYKRILLILLCTFVVGITSVTAASSCSTSTKKRLAQNAARVKVEYEIKDFSEEKTLEVDGKETTYKVPNYIFEITVYNVTEDLTVYIQKSNSEKQITVNFENTTDGTYTFTDSNFGEIYNYNVYVRSNADECRGVTLRTTKFTKPRYNAYSEFTYCQNSSNYYCQRFIKSEISIKDTDDFLNKIEVNNDKNDPNKDYKENKEALGKLFKENWKTYLLIFVIVLAAGTGAVFFIRNYQKKSGWKL